ncbi:MAG: putative membrane-anchored cell surface protein, partial [Candidatus Peregrinibacteria bacterium Greene0416_19]
NMRFTVPSTKVYSFATGNVGVGKSAPITKLEVVGTISGSLLSVGVGSVSAPSLSFSNDSNTGLYWVSADKLGFATGSNSRMVIDANGNVGIGSTAPSPNSFLTVSGSAVTTYTAWIGGTGTNRSLALSNQNTAGVTFFTFMEGSDSNSSTPAYIQRYNSAHATTALRNDLEFSGTGDFNFLPTGNVGIGKSNGLAKLDVVGTISGTTLQINGAGTFLTDITVSGGDITGAGGAALDLGESTAGDVTVTGDLIVADDSFLGLSSSAGRIVFDDQGTDEINILSARLGVGTSAPTTALDVVGTISGSALQVSGNATMNGNLTLSHSTTPVISISNTAGGAGLNLTRDASGNGFIVRNSSTGLNMMTVSAVGNVGIGRSAAEFASSALVVSGSTLIGNGLNRAAKAQLDVVGTISGSKLTIHSGPNYSSFLGKVEVDDNSGAAGGALIVDGILTTDGTSNQNVRSIFRVGGTQTGAGSTAPASVYAFAETSSALTATDLAGVMTYFSKDHTGTLTNYYGLLVNNMSNNAGTITNTYGVYIGDLTHGTQTINPYGIYVSDTGIRNYFGGPVGIGSSSPAAKLTVTGSGSISGNVGIGKTTTNLAKLDVVGTISGSNLYIATNAGIGVASPGKRLEVYADAGGQDSTGNGLKVTRTDNTTIYAHLYPNNGFSENGMSFDVSGIDTMYFSSTDGDVVIGTMTSGAPGSKLFVNGGVNVGGAITDAAPTGGLLVSGNTGMGKTNAKAKLDVAGTISGSALTLSGPANNSYILGNLSIGKTGAGLSKLDVVGTISGSALAINGNAGIGTSSPSFPLHVKASTNNENTVFRIESSANSDYVRVMDTGIIELSRLIRFYEGASSRFAFYPVDTNTLGVYGYSGVGDIAVFNRTTGHVGVGTTGPEARLQVAGGGLCVGSDANCNTDNNTEGVVYSSSTSMTIYDVAEMYPTRDAALFSTGAVVVALDTGTGVFVKHASAGDRRLLGVVSAEPAVLLGGFNGSQFVDERQVAVALSGRVPVKVTTEGGTIAIGDPLTVGSTIGVARKARLGEQTVGYALQAFTGSTVGQVQVFVKTGAVAPGEIAMTGSTLTLHSASLSGALIVQQGALIRQQLTVGGNGTGTLLSVKNGANTVFRVDGNGEVYADGAFHSGGADYAEFFMASSPIAAGEAVCMDVTTNNKVKRCDKEADPNIIGIRSRKPSIVGNSIPALAGLPAETVAKAGFEMVGLIGQLDARAVVTGGEDIIRAGDSLTSAAIPGYLRRARAGEATVGVAMTSLENGDGTIRVLIARSNKSLTVEAVEDRVRESVAALKIEDEIRGSLARSLQTLTASDTFQKPIVDEVQKQIGSLKVDDRIVDLASRLTTLSGALAAKPAPAITTMDMLVLENDLKVGGLVTLGGDLKAGGKITANTLNAQSIVSEGTLTVASDARIGGNLYLEGTLKVQDLFVPGALKIDGALQASVLRGGEAEISGLLKSEQLEVSSGATLHGAATLAGDLTLGGRLILNGTGSAIEAKELIIRSALFVHGPVTIEGLAAFLGDVEVKGQLTVSNKQAGYAVIDVGQNDVRVSFGTGVMMRQPIVTASPDVPVLYAVTKASATGFTIKLGAPAAERVTFSWLSLGAENPLTQTGSDFGQRTSDFGELKEFPVDGKGVPVSSDQTWNNCIRNIATFREDGKPVSCSEFGTGFEWRHPELDITFAYRTDLTPPLLVLPEGWVTTIVDYAPTPSPSPSATPGRGEESGTGSTVQSSPSAPGTATGSGSSSSAPATSTGTGSSSSSVSSEPPAGSSASASSTSSFGSFGSSESSSSSQPLIGPATEFILVPLPDVSSSSSSVSSVTGSASSVNSTASSASSI